VGEWPGARTLLRDEKASLLYCGMNLYCGTKRPWDEKSAFSDVGRKVLG
jgi:hypothetical protein